MALTKSQGNGRFGVHSLRGRALRLLSQRDYTRAEMLAKLTPHCSSMDELHALLADMMEKGWLDDKRAADSLVHRQATRYGVVRIRRDLQAKGVAPDLIVEALTELADSELMRATAVWHKKFGSMPETPTEQAKQIRFLLARGFSVQVIRQVIRGVDERLGEDGGDV
jgi:regulatory protein